MNVRKARAIIAIGVNTKELDKQLEASRKKLRSFMKGAKGVGGAMFGAAKSMGGALMGGFGIEAAGGLLNIVSGVMDVEKALTRFQISSQSSNQDIAKMRAEMLRVSSATGVGRDQLIKGAQAYVDFTSDAKGAREQLELFAEITAGSNVAMDDVAAVAATMKKNLGIDAKDFRPAFDILIKQAQLGSFEISSLASEMSKVTPQFSQFAGARSTQGLAELGAMLQVAIDGFGSAEEASTGFNGLMTQINKNQKKLKKLGVNVIDPKTGKLRNLLDIVRAISANKALNKPGALLATLGEEKAVRALTMLSQKLKEVDRIKADSLNSDQVAKNNLMFQNSTAGKLGRAFETLKNKVAQVFTPERIAAFADALVKVLDVAVKLVNTIEDMWKATDFGGVGTKMLADNEAAKHVNMTPEQLRTKAQAYSLRAATSANPYEKQVAQQVAAELNRRSTNELAYATSRAGIDFPAFAAAMQNAVKEGIAKSKIVVTTNDNAIAQTVANAPSKAQPKRR